jgi:hypothetical protein
MVEKAMKMVSSHRMRENEDSSILFLDGRGEDGRPFDFTGSDDD